VFIPNFSAYGESGCIGFGESMSALRPWRSLSEVGTYLQNGHSARGTDLPSWEAVMVGSNVLLRHKRRNALRFSALRLAYLGVSD
jgi:hypothetical protein